MPMAQLPAAVASILPALAADHGRARAETLLVILGAGPDDVRHHVHDIDLALGASSPGVVALTDLVDRAEQAISPSQPTIRKQHYISRVVLDQFAEDLPPAGFVVARFDLVSGAPLTPTGPRGIGYVSDFVTIDSQATEALWKNVEDVLRDAILAALSGTTTACQRSTLRRVVALHLVRHPRTLTIHHNAFGRAVESQIERLLDTPFAVESFRHHYGGLFPAGPEARRIGLEAGQERLVRLYQDGALWRLSIQRMYEAVCDRFDQRGVEVVTPASPTQEFLLGDKPTVTINRTTGSAGIAEGVVVDQADEIVMPFGPRLLVAVGRPDGQRSISDDEVEQYNRLQVRVAMTTDRARAFHRPGSCLAWTIAAMRP